MPKSAKKKKEKVADFSVTNLCYRFVHRATYPLLLGQKAKLKLGKGKKQPTNAVDTTFKARCLFVFLVCRRYHPYDPADGRTKLSRFRLKA